MRPFAMVTLFVNALLHTACAPDRDSRSTVVGPKLEPAVTSPRIAGSRESWPYKTSFRFAGNMSLILDCNAFRIWESEISKDFYSLVAEASKELLPRGYELEQRADKATFTLSRALFNKPVDLPHFIEISPLGATCIVQVCS